MTTTKQARHSHFQRGSGVFVCRVCGRNTRNTGDNGAIHLCEQCYEIAGYENQFSDDGGKLSDSAKQNVRSLFAQLAEHIGGEAAAQTSPELFMYVATDCVTLAPATESLLAPVAGANVQVMESPAEPATEGNDRVYVVVGLDAQGEVVLACVSARSNGSAKRQGRKLGIVEELHARRAA